MSEYTDLAMARRKQLLPNGRPVYNCCQAVVSIFAERAGYDEQAALKAATVFRGGMQMGSVCGAVTGGLMALGLAGVDDSQTAAEYLQKIRQMREGMINCGDLLRVNAERGGEKMPFCNALICECVECVEEALRRTELI